MLLVPLAASLDTGTLVLVLLGALGFVLLVVRGLLAARTPPTQHAAPEPGPSGNPAAGTTRPEAGADEEAGLPVQRVDQDWRALDDPDREVDGTEGRPLEPVEALVARLRGGDARTCERAIDGLVRHGQAAVPALTAALSDPDPDLRVDARRALDRIAGA